MKRARLTHSEKGVGRTENSLLLSIKNIDSDQRQTRIIPLSSIQRRPI